MLNILEVQPSTEPQERWTVDSQEKAAWALRKLRKLRQAQAENTNTANAIMDSLRKEIEDAQEWLRQQNEGLEQEASFFVGGLELYHRKLMEENPKQKTVKLPFGTLKLRAQQPEYIRDEEKLKLWAKANRTDCMKIVEKVQWDELKKSVVVVNGNVTDTTTGAVIDGVMAQERPAKFEVVTE